MVYIPTIEDIERVCNIATSVIAICSIIANMLPHPQEESLNKFLSVTSKIVNAIALNITKLKKAG